MAIDQEFFSHLSAEIKQIEDLERLRFIGDDGGWYAAIGLSTRFFVSDGHLAHRRRAAINALHSYYLQFKSNLTHYIMDSGAARPLNEDEAFGFFRGKENFESTEIGALILGLAGFPDHEPQEQPLYNECRMMMNMGSENDHYLYSDWSASLAFSALPTPYHEKLLDCVRKWAEIIKPRHGTSGISFLIDQDFDHARISQILFPHLMRFPGLDYDDGGNWTGIAGRSQKIRSVNWLNIIDDEFVEKLGGLTAMIAALGPECPVHLYEGGVIIQAGPRPQVGDVNAGTIPEHYRTVSQFLRPLRFEEYDICLINPPRILDPIQETLKWIRRFD